MANFAPDAARVVENMARRAVSRASGAGVLLGQEKYYVGGGLLVCVAHWDREPHRVAITWSLTPEPGKPAERLTEEEVQALIERRMRDSLSV